MTGSELMQALSAMSSSTLELEVTVLIGDSWVTVEDVDEVEGEDGSLWPVIELETGGSGEGE